MKILLRLHGPVLLALMMALHGSHPLEHAGAVPRSEEGGLARLMWADSGPEALELPRGLTLADLPARPTLAVPPRIHWVAFDVGPERKIWAVFAQDAEDGPRWPVLALDLDRDGEIGEIGELFRSTELDPRQLTQRWYVGDLPSDDPERPHTELEVRHHGWTFRWRLRWYGGDWLYGGGAATVEESLLAFDPADAPHFDLHMGGDGPEWVPVRSEALLPGATQRLSVLIGSPGQGPLATSAFSEARIPSGWTPTGRVHYEDAEGRPRSVSADLPWASCGITREGLVDVPRDLNPWAPVRVEITLPEGCPTAIPDVSLTWPTVQDEWTGRSRP